MLFGIGTVVFSISVFGLFWYGYFLVNRAFQLDLASEAVDQPIRATLVDPDEENVATDVRD